MEKLPYRIASRRLLAMANNRPSWIKTGLVINKLKGYPVATTQGYTETIIDLLALVRMENYIRWEKQAQVIKVQVTKRESKWLILLEAKTANGFKWVSFQQGSSLLNALRTMGNAIRHRAMGWKPSKYQ